jgi:hypothetical protein
MPMTAEQQEFQQRVAREQYQANYDETLRQIGMRAPQPVIGQSPDDYRRETLRQLKKTYLQNHELYRVNMRSLRSDALQAFEPQVLSAVLTEAVNPNNVPKGELKQVKELNVFGQVSAIKFIGQESFVKQLGRPGRRVASFLLNGVHVDASGRALRR